MKTNFFKKFCLWGKFYAKVKGWGKFWMAWKRKFLTFGSGVKYSAFTLDFSYLVNANNDAGATNPLANTMRFSMIWNFGVSELN